MFSLTFHEEPKAIAKQASIHETSAPSVSTRTVMDLLGRMGLHNRIDGLSWERELNWITASDDEITVSCNEVSGGLQYRLRPLSDEPGRSINTDEAKLEQIARDYLSQIGRPAGDEALHLGKVTYLYCQTADTNGKASDPSKLDAGVIFTRIIDELPVVGAGGVAMVKIGTDDTVVGGREVWRSISKSGSKVSLRSPSEAMRLLETKLKHSGLKGEWAVRRAWQGYVESGIEEAQRHFEPCYAFVIESINALFDTKKVVVIPAARVGPMAAAFTA